MVSPESTQPLIEAVDLTKRRGRRVVLDALSLTVRPGEIYALLGSRGSGASVVVSLFLGFEAPTSGRALVAGIPVATRPLAARQQLAYVSPRCAFPSSAPVREAVRWFATLPHPTRAPDEAAVEAALRRAGVPDRAFDAPSGTLGPELTVPLWLAVARLRDTPIVVAHNPTEGLNRRAAADVQDFLIELREQGKAVLLTTTDRLVAGQVADRLAILEDGRRGAERLRADVWTVGVES